MLYFQDDLTTKSIQHILDTYYLYEKKIRFGDKVGNTDRKVAKYSGGIHDFLLD